MVFFANGFDILFEKCESVQAVLQPTILTKFSAPALINKSSFQKESIPHSLSVKAQIGGF